MSIENIILEKTIQQESAISNLLPSIWVSASLLQEWGNAHPVAFSLYFKIKFNYIYI